MSNVLDVPGMTAIGVKRDRPQSMSDDLVEKPGINKRKPQETPASQDALKKTNTNSAEGSHPSQQ